MSRMSQSQEEDKTCIKFLSGIDCGMRLIDKLSKKTGTVITIKLKNGNSTGGAPG